MIERNAPMNRFAATFILAMSASAAFAQDATPLKFDPDQLCAWQKANNGMDETECKKLETEAQATIADLEKAAEQARKDECKTEARNFSGDSGFASFTVYATCLKDGPGSL
jgi:hypothetical protein